jgi:hypothetical protein
MFLQRKNLGESTGYLRDLFGKYQLFGKGNSEKLLCCHIVCLLIEGLKYWSRAQN